VFNATFNNISVISWQLKVRGAGVKVHNILVVEHRAEIIAKSLEVGKTEEMGTNSPNLVVKQRTGLITPYLEGEETKNKDFCNFP
jgi:hypothetical protein